MTFKKYNHANNAFCELMTDLGSSDTTMLLQGNFNRFPTENFIVKLSKVSGNSVVARENIYVANRNNNICTGLVRAYEKVPMNDDAAENIQQALNFSAGDMVEVVISSEFLKDIQNRLENSVEKNRGLRIGFGQNKTVIIDSNGDETIVNSTTGNPADTDMFRLQTQDGNEKKVLFSTIRNAVSGNEITLTAGENITGVAPIPVISIPQGNYTLNIMPHRPNTNTPFQNGSMYDGAQFSLVSGSWQSNKYRIPGDFIMDLGKVRKITSLHLLIETSNFSVHIYHSNTNGDWISTMQRNSISTHNSGSGREWVRLDIQKDCRFLRITSTYGSVNLFDVEIIEERTLNGVYAAQPENPLLSRVDGFLMAPANSGESVQLHTTEQFSTLNGFTSVSNGLIFLSGKGLMSTTANHHQVGVVKHGKLLRDSARISGNETQLLFFFMDNKFSGNQGYSAGWHYGEPRAIEYGHYKIRMEGQGAYSSGGRSTVFLQYSIDGENWLSVWSYSAHSGAANVDVSLRLHAGFVRFATQYHQSVNSDGTFWIKSLTLSSLVG